MWVLVSLTCGNWHWGASKIGRRTKRVCLVLFFHFFVCVCVLIVVIVAEVFAWSFTESELFMIFNKSLKCMLDSSRRCFLQTSRWEDNKKRKNLFFCLFYFIGFTEKVKLRKYLFLLFPSPAVSKLESQTSSIQILKQTNKQTSPQEQLELRRQKQ